MQGVLRRQAEFDSAAAAFARYRAAPAFADWSEASLWAYIRHGFAPLAGRPGAAAAARPEIEAAMLRPIFEAMEQVYTGDARGNPFAWLAEIELSGARRHDGEILADLQGNGVTRRSADAGTPAGGRSTASVTASRQPIDARNS